MLAIACLDSNAFRPARSFDCDSMESTDLGVISLWRLPFVLMLLFPGIRDFGELRVISSAKASSRSAAKAFLIRSFHEAGDLPSSLADKRASLILLVMGQKNHTLPVLRMFQANRLGPFVAAVRIY